MKLKFNKEFKISTIGGHNNFYIDTEGVSKTPSTNSNINGFQFASNKGQSTKSPRFIDTNQIKKKYISPRGKREKSKKYTLSKTKEYSHPKTKEYSYPKSKESSQARKGIDKKYFDYIKHNESLNYYDTKRTTGFNGINISIQEVDNKNKTSSKPQYGTGNMSHIIALLNEKKSALSNSKKTKRNTSNQVSMKKLASLNKSMNKSSY
jgi:hypothetical protein